MSLTIKGGQEPGRNYPCPCDSGLKYKQCHGDPGKKSVCEAIVRETMLKLIRKEQLKHELITQEEYDLIESGRVRDAEAEETEDERKSPIWRP